MIYDLKLSHPGNSYFREETKDRIAIKKKLEEINNFEKRLAYYNKNIKSLALFAMEPKIHFEWGNPDQTIKLYCACNTCKRSANFNPEHENIFINLRAKEVKRIADLVNKAQDYKEKLEIYYQLPGTYIDNDPTITANIPIQPGKNNEAIFHMTNPLIDLRPKRKQEIKLFNEVAYQYCEGIFLDKNGFKKRYNGFDYTKEKERLDITLNKALDPSIIIQQLIERIEQHFGYPDNLKKGEVKFQNKVISDYLKPHRNFKNYFLSMAAGVDVTFDVDRLDTTTFGLYTHSKEIFKYYKYLRALKAGEKIADSNASLRDEPETKKIVDMKDERLGIEKLKKIIANKTKRQKIESINGYLDTYQDNQKALGKQIWAAYHFDFEEEALKLRGQIESDNSIAYERDWNWYYNTDNIPNNKAVVATREFIESKRKDEFDSLYFFNLLFKQKDELKDNLDMPIDFIHHLRELSLGEVQKHILFGMILYWHGGYPVDNMDPKFNTILKLIEKDFLAMFPDIVTPEKVFCSGDYEFKVKIKELENRANNNIQVLISKGKIHGVEFDFGDLPLYVITEVKNKFDQKTIEGTSKYETWIYFFKKFLLTIPEAIRLTALKKGIAYGEMRYNFFLTHECTDRLASPYAQCWERRLALANDLLKEMTPEIKLEKPNMPLKREFNIISNSAKDRFFYLIISHDKAIDDTNESNKEINKIISEIENNISIEGMNAAQYLCLYLEDINIRMQIFKDMPDSFSGINTDSRLRILMYAYNKVSHFLDRINHLYGSAIYPKSIPVSIQPKEKEIKIEPKIIKQDSESLKSIEPFLSHLKPAFNNEADYLKSLELVNAFFSNKTVNVNLPLFVKNGNTKNLAFALGEIWRSKSNEVISYEYLQFYKKTFSIFNSQVLDKNRLFSNNLYKYSISKT